MSTLMPTRVEYHYNYHYHGPYNNYGQNSTGQATINNISTLPSNATDCPQNPDSKNPAELKSSSETPNVRCSCEVRSEDQPTTIHSPSQAACEVRSEDQPADLKSTHALEAQSKDQLPAPSRVDKPIGNTINVDRTTSRNIVVFGQTGSGKSSIINMLAGSSVASVSGGPADCTPSNQHYISHGVDNYTFWDTPGLDEAQNSVSLGGDVHNLLNLVKDHGVNLLIYCIRGSLADITRVNYDFFWEIICVKEVPIVLVVSGLEGRDDMDEWWQENIKTITKMKMVFAGHACIMSWKEMCDGYEEAAEKVWKLVRDHSTPKPWHMTPGRTVKAQRIIAAYKKHFKAHTMRKILRDLERSLV